MPYNILVVDDDKELREELRDCLDDYQVVMASSGEEALDILKRPNEIDLVILDVMMPGASGTDVLKDIKQIAPEVVVIMLTGHSSKDVAIEALKGNADDYLEKPVDIDELKEIIENHLSDKEKREIGVDDIDGKIERVKHFAQRNWHKKVSLNDAASVVFLSPKYLSRIFKQHTGADFKDYVLHIKIKKAKEILCATRLTINQISDKLGYQNTESFIRIFKKITKKTPTSYRLKHTKTNRGRKKILSF